MRNYDYWVIEKRKKENQNKIILFLSGIFYKTFDDDARCMSDKFGFKIQKSGGYESVGFPKNSFKKYLKLLKENNYGYTVFKKVDSNLKIECSFDGGNKLEYFEKNIVYLEDKLGNKSFKNFVNEFEKLIQKYS